MHLAYSFTRCVGPVWAVPGAEKMESYIKDGFRIADITANWQGYELDLCLELPYFHPRLTEDNLVLYSEQDAEVVPETPVPKTPAPTPVAVPKPPESTPGEAIAEASEGDVPEAPAATTPRDAIPAVRPRRGMFQKFCPCKLFASTRSVSWSYRDLRRLFCSLVSI